MTTKLSSRMRTGQRVAAPATMMAPIQPMVPSTYTGPTGGNGGNGNCGPAPMTVPRSWGPACPTGFCTAQDLAANLGRAFAGERYPCRELTYWTSATADAAGVATFADNSRVTICPTRVIIDHADVLVNQLLTVFEMGNQNQIIGDGIPVPFLNSQSYVIIPFVTDCLRAGLPFSWTVTGLTPDDVVYFGLIGPVIG